MAITPDQIKDSSRLVAVVNQPEVTLKKNSPQFYYAVLSLPPSTTWESPVFDLQGYTLYGLQLAGQNTPDTVGGSILFSGDSTFPYGGNSNRLSASLAAGYSVASIGVTAPATILARYGKIRVTTPATAGTYTILLVFAYFP